MPVLRWHLKQAYRYYGGMMLLASLRMVAGKGQDQSPSIQVPPMPASLMCYLTVAGEARRQAAKGTWPSEDACPSYSSWFRGFHFVGILHPFWLLHSFCLSPYLQVSLSPEGKKGLIEISYLEVECSKVSPCLYNVSLSVSVFVFICCKTRLLWWWLIKALIYEYSRVSLRVILLLCLFVCLFS